MAVHFVWCAIMHFLFVPMPGGANRPTVKEQPLSNSRFSFDTTIAANAHGRFQRLALLQLGGEKDTLQSATSDFDVASKNEYDEDNTQLETQNEAGTQKVADVTAAWSSAANSAKDEDAGA